MFTILWCCGFHSHAGYDCLVESVAPGDFFFASKPLFHLLTSTTMTNRTPRFLQQLEERMRPTRGSDAAFFPLSDWFLNWVDVIDASRTERSAVRAEVRAFISNKQNAKRVSTQPTLTPATSDAEDNLQSGPKRGGSVLSRRLQNVLQLQGSMTPTELMRVKEGLLFAGLHPSCVRRHRRQVLR